MQYILREFDVCRWPPPVWLIEEAKVVLKENSTPSLRYVLKDYISAAEQANNLFNTVYEALDSIEQAEKKMTSEKYLRLLDSMHKLASVGERKSDLYSQMFSLAQTAMPKLLKN
jgi:hypothetical protein